MEIRKVQVTGGSSFVVTLPKEWIRSSNIKKNDPLGIVVQPDGTLMITPQTDIKKMSMTKEIFVDDVSSPNYLFRLLIGAYIMGYSNIIIRSKKTLDAYVRDTVVIFTQLAIGPEIMEETDESISITDLLSPTEMPFDKTIRRMHLIVRAMHEDTLKVLTDGDPQLAERIVKRDRDVDRLEWLVARQSNIVLGNIRLGKEMGVTPEEAKHYSLISRAIERIGDHAVKIAENTPVLMEKKSDPKLVNKISKASKYALDIFNNSIDAWIKRDIDLANTNIERKKQLVDLCEEIIDHPIKSKRRTYMAVSYIAESIRRTGEYSGGISEIVINSVIKD